MLTVSRPVYLAVTNLLSLALFLAFVKCLLDLTTLPVSLTLTILFSLAYAASLLLAVRVRPAANRSLIHLSVYLKDLPLALAALFYSSQAAYTQPALSLHPYLLLAAACLLSALTSLTNVLTEHNFRLHKPTNFLLQLSFRYFYLIGRLIGLTAFLSTFNDTPGSPLFVTATLAACLAASFAAYFALSWPTASSTPKALSVAFDSLRLLVDFSSRPFKGHRLRLILFALGQLVLQAFFAYFWYFRAQAILEEDQGRTTLFSLLTKQRTRISLYNMNELEAKLSQRRLALIGLIGCFVIAALSYYARSISSGCPQKSAALPEVSVVEVGRLTVEDRTDGFSVDTYQTSSSLATSMSSFMSPLLYDTARAHLDNNRAMSCSTCSSSSRSFSSLLMTPRGPFYSLRRGLDYDTSSGVESSLDESDVNDLGYLRSCQVTPGTWAGRTGRNLGGEFNASGLRQLGVAEGGVAAKVDRWFVDVEQQAVVKCSESFLV
jgi:hypothetical protein